MALNDTRFLTLNPILFIFPGTSSSMNIFFLLSHQIILPLLILILLCFPIVFLMHLISDAPYVSDPPNLPLVDSILATSQPDSTIDPTPSASNTSHCYYQPDVSLPSALDPVVPPSPPSLDQSLLISSSSSLPALRRSTRTHHPPSYLAYYSCKVVSTKPASGLPYDISNVLSYSYLGPQFASFVMAVSSVPSEPISFSPAV